ncbi:hypothetical protein NIES4074_57850 [Cylindrospermum sp. NIES-4074]|nr:hypothetical protein NIES4074_57850 [Cylindrospermum sp. NIES-4074]
MKANNRLEINDLIDDAVNNALARRNEALASVSDDEAKNIAGGALSNPIILGKIPVPITIGIIVVPTKTYYAQESSSLKLN